MKPRDRQKHKGRKETGTFSQIPHAVQDSPNWKRCAGTSIKLLCALVRQYNGRNNGDLCAAESILEAYGIRHGETIGRALSELLHYGLIIRTRQGGLHKASLYAVTWKPIDECGGKLDVAPTRTSPGDWRAERDAFKPAPRKRAATTESVPRRYGIRSSRAPPCAASVRKP
jgi:hypothetical protein